MIFSSWELLSPHLVFLVRLVLQKELPCNSSPLPSWLMWPEDHRILSPSLTSYLDSLRIPGKKTRFTRYQWITECEQSSWQTFNNFKYYLKRLHFILPLSLHLIHSQENLLGYRCGHPVSLPFGCLAAHFPSQPPTLLPCLYRKGNFSLTPLPVGLDSLERDATTVGDSDAIRFIEEVWPTRFSLSCERNAWQLTTCRAHFAHDLFRIRVVILNSNVLKTLAKAPTNTAPSRSFLFVTEKNWNRTFFSQCLVTEKTLSWRLINFNRSDFFLHFVVLEVFQVPRRFFARCESYPPFIGQFWHGAVKRTRGAAWQEQWTADRRIFRFLPLPSRDHASRHFSPQLPNAPVLQAKPNLNSVPHGPSN